MKSWIKISFFPLFFIPIIKKFCYLMTYMTEWSGYSPPDGQHAAYPL